MITSTCGLKHGQRKRFRWHWLAWPVSLTAAAQFAAATPPPFFIAPEGSPFVVQNPVPGDPGETARHFVLENLGDLGIDSPNISFGISSVRPRGQLTIVHLREVYGGVPIFGTAILVDLNPDLTVNLLINGILPDTAFLDQGGLSLTPDVSAQQAEDFALQQFAPGVPSGDITVSEPQLRIFDPRRLGLNGLPHLVWDFRFDVVDKAQIGRRVLIDAHTPAVIRAFAPFETALNRRIYDADNMNTDGTLIRSEGDPASGLSDADTVYAYLQDTYDYYMAQFGRDSFDDSGGTIKATVRWCTEDPNDGCPWYNGQEVDSTHRLYLGAGYVADDVVAHEYTHAVTNCESGLIYENESGAMNEAFSDIFGELVDLSNGAGNDAPGVRWLHGEDLPGGANRSMSNPPSYLQPDRISSVYFVPPTTHPNEGNDYGGVHTNSGVVNKLFYLLCDGDTFNGYSVEGMGLDDPGQLFYSAQTLFLYEASDFNDLSDALQAAANVLGWSAHYRNNLYNAYKSVEIAREWDVYVDKAAVGLAGKGFSDVPFGTVANGVSAARPGDRIYIRQGDYLENMRIEEHLTLTTWDPNTTVSIGTRP